MCGLFDERRREALAHLQQGEAIEVRRRSDALQARVEAFRAFFLKNAPFAVPDDQLAIDQVAASAQQFSIPSSYHFAYWTSLALLNQQAHMHEGYATRNQLRPAIS